MELQLEAVTKNYKSKEVLKGMEKSRAKKRIEELVRSVGLWDDLKRKCVTYSGGMQHKLCWKSRI